MDIRLIRIYINLKGTFVTLHLSYNLWVNWSHFIVKLLHIEDSRHNSKTDTFFILNSVLHSSN